MKYLVTNFFFVFVVTVLSIDPALGNKTCKRDSDCGTSRQCVSGRCMGVACPDPYFEFDEPTAQCECVCDAREAGSQTVCVEVGAGEDCDDLVRDKQTCLVDGDDGPWGGEIVSCN